MNMKAALILVSVVLLALAVSATSPVLAPEQTPTQTPTSTPYAPFETLSPTPNPQTMDSLAETSLAIAILAVAVAAVLLGRRKTTSP
jgi:hypothetical protein